VASLSQGRTAAAQCGLFTHKSVPVIFEPPCTRNLPQQLPHVECTTRQTYLEMCRVYGLRYASDTQQKVVLQINM